MRANQATLACAALAAACASMDADDRRLFVRLSRRRGSERLRGRRLAFGVEEVGGALLATVHVAHLDAHGALRMPEGTDSVVMEVGCSDFGTLDERLDLYPGAFHVAFEPLLDKYAFMLDKGRRHYSRGEKDIGVPLGMHHSRGTVLPMAVSPNGGAINFTVSEVAGCSSMRPISGDTGWAPTLAQGQSCSKVLETRVVPSVTLSRALRLVGNRCVQLLKLDAQGVDFELVRSAPPELLRSRVELIQMEVLKSGCRPLYAGQPDDTVVAPFMESIGFPATEPCTPKHQKCECDMSFARRPDKRSRQAGSGGGVCSADKSLLRGQRAAALRSQRAAAKSEAVAWRGVARHGFCAKTSAAAPNDCNAGAQGSFGLDAGDSKTGTAASRSLRAIAQCLSHCHGCARCRFISVSTRWADCSWFHSCALDQLDTSVAGFLSAAVHKQKVA